MKRSEMLTSLSHDHHQALRACQLLSRSDQESADLTRESFVRFWGPHQNHIRIEESILFPKFAKYQADGELLERALKDHEAISALADDVITAETPSIDAMHALGEKLSEHVRFEERELFPAIEAAIPDDQQAALLAELAHTDSGPGWQPDQAS